MNLRDYVWLPLDVQTLEDAKPIVDLLAPHVSTFKVGLELLTAEGAPQVMNFLSSRGVEKIFFDGKFCDIPNTVAGASKAAVKLGANYFNVHVSCGKTAVAAAVANKGNSKVLAVTVLTSLESQDLAEVGMADGISSPGYLVKKMACLAASVGVDGLICSPKDLSSIANEDVLRGLMKVTPGVRPQWANVGDQKRVMTPFEAIKAGATALVIGRPITNPPKEIGTPLDALKKIFDEIELALGSD